MFRASDITAEKNKYAEEKERKKNRKREKVSERMNEEI